jgi:hypothetical protein
LALALIWLLVGVGTAIVFGAGFELYSFSCELDEAMEDGRATAEELAR